MWSKVAVLLVCCVSFASAGVIISSEEICEARISAFGGDSDVEPNDRQDVGLGGSLKEILKIIKGFASRHGGIFPPQLKDLSDLKDACDDYHEALMLLDGGAGLGAAAVGTPVPPTRSLSGWVVADFNGDAKTDSLEVSGPGYYLQLQVADGSLAPRTRIDWPSRAIYAWGVAADLNKDGKTDLVMCCGTANTSDSASRLAIALGKGDGTFQPPVDSIAATGAFAYVDWNGDGTKDVLAMTPAGVLTVALGQSNGTFQVARTSGPVSGTSVIASDATADGRVDAIVLGYTSVTVFPGMPDGSLGTPYSTALTGGDARTVTAADFTGDGVLDLVVTYPLGMAEMLKGNPGTPFSRTGVFSTGKFDRVLALDLDNQGPSVLLLPDTAGGGLRIVPFSSGGTPLTAPLYGIPAVGTSYPSYDPQFSSVAVGDFNGDGKDDVALSALLGNDTTLQVFLGGPLNKLSRMAPIRVATRSLRQLAAGDLTGDGRAELLALDVDARNLLTYRSNASGGFDAPVITALGAAPGVMALGDFSGDGRTDVAVTVAGRILIFQSTGTGTFTGPLTINANAVWLAAGDFNGDKRMDLAYTTSGNAAVILNQGNNVFAAPVPLDSQTYSISALRAADLNRDGKLDLVIGGLGTGQGFGVFLGDGAGAFRALPPQDGNYYATLDIVIADLDNDGIPDMLTTHCCDVVSTYHRFGRGDGTFTAPHLHSTGSNTDRIFLTDLNGDGKPEITAHTYSGVSVTPFAAPKQAGISSAASGRGPTLATASIASAYGVNLASATLSATANNQTEIGGTRVIIGDAQHNLTEAPLFFVSAGQVNFLIPSTVAAGAASVTIQSPGGVTSVADLTVARIAPGLFVVDSTRLVAANVIRVKANGTQLSELPYRVEGGALVGLPIDLGPAGETVVLVLYGTGLRGRVVLSQVSATIGGTAVPVAFAGAQNEFPGLDQVNVTIPRSFIGRGSVDVIVTVEGQASNAGRLIIQ